MNPALRQLQRELEELQRAQCAREARHVESRSGAEGSQVHDAPPTQSTHTDEAELFEVEPFRYELFHYDPEGDSPLKLRSHKRERLGVDFANCDTSELRSQSIALLGKTVMLARAGNLGAAKVLETLATSATIQLTKLLASNRRMVRELKKTARSRDAWPLMKSVKSGWGDDGMELFKTLEVGLGTPFLTDPSARAKHDDLAGKLARQLWHHVNHVKTSYSAPSLRHLSHGETPVLPPWAQAASTLPPFTKDTAYQWWEVAKLALLERYPRPERNVILKRLDKTGGRPSSPGRIRARVFVVLRGRFRSLAPKM